MDWHETERLIEEQAPELARRFREAASDRPNEATFRSRVQPVIEDFCKAAGVEARPVHERTLAVGRPDTVYNRLVVEYKAPGVLRPLRTDRQNREIIDRQLKPYMEELARREHHQIDRLAGVVFDGCYYIFIRHTGQAWHEDDPLPVTPESTEQFLRYLVSLQSGVALIADNLIRDFGIATVYDPRKRTSETMVNPRTQRLLRALVQSLQVHLGGPSGNSLVRALSQQWRTFYSEVVDYRDAFGGKLRELSRFAERLGVSLHREEEALIFFFALHTYFALLVKLLAWLTLSRYVAVKLGAPHFSQLANLTSEELRRQLQEMESGGIFRHYGIRNLLEGDFFSWYLHGWSESLEQALRDLLNRLAQYDPSTVEVSPEETRDLLKKLYHGLLPREIRHNLGEYYTPDWLAQRLLTQVDGEFFTADPERSAYVKRNLLRLRFLDPACGSGTFLVLIIRRIREAARELKLPEDQVLEAILRNVVGIDLNPLAVIAARTNYLIALGGLLEHRRGEIEIPVYMADSIVTPVRGQDLFQQGRFVFRSSVGELAVPEVAVQKGRLDRLASLLDEEVRAEVSPEVFVQRASKELGLSEIEADQAKEVLRELYNRLLDLHRQGLNGVWARILKNAFAPLFIGRFDYVVGNPPWVNWENVPDGYRDATAPLWERYNLTARLGGGRPRLGSVKRDLSSLMLYVVADQHLEAGGKLGFIITQSVFKVGAASGFRRFSLPDGTGLRVLHVDDMTELQPFEGASNRTAVLILEKGRATSYPVPYTYWRKVRRGRSLGFDMELEEVQSVTLRSRFQARPIESNDLTSPWITGRPLALRAIQKVLGSSDYRAHEGVNTGGANAVYWVDIVGQRPDGLVMVTNITEGAKRGVEQVTMPLEPDLLYPLLRGRDVKRWRAEPSAWIVVPQDPSRPSRAYPEEALQRDYPKTYAYLKRFESVLRQRSGFRQILSRRDSEFYGLMDIDRYTFAPYKVVWREVSHTLDAAVAEQIDNKSVVPDHTLILVACTTREEAHYLCAVLNSSPARFAVQNYIVLHPDPHVLERVGIPQFDFANAIHLRLAHLSKEAHELVAKEDFRCLENVEEEIDRWAARLWGLSERELRDIQRSLQELVGGGEEGAEPPE
jgi:hypothetical protein